MANLRTRGQLLLIGAVVLAVTLVGLSIVTNTAIFTENLATERDTDAERALVYQQEMTRVMEDTVEAANWNNNSEASSLDDAVDETVDETTDHTGRQAAEASIIADISVQSGSTEHGSLVFQNESQRTLETGNANDSTPQDWVVVGDVHSPDGTGTRAFTMNLTEVPDSIGSTPFTVHVDEDGNGYGLLASSEWNMTVEGNVTDSSEPVTVAVDSGLLGGSTETCDRAVKRGYVEIDVTGGTVAGEPCDALRGEGSFADGVTAPYNISFESGDEVRGNYSLVTTNETVAERAEDNSSSPGYHLNWTESQGAPYGRYAIYDLSMDLTFYSADVTYEAEFRIARGEPDG